MVDVKLCECGCGEPAPIATYNAPKRGYIKDEPVRFISGHNSWGRKVSIEARAKMAEAARRQGQGSNHHAWRGGTHLQRGRRKVFVGVDHPMADHGGYVFEYRLVAAAALGRFLQTNEHVHHVDCDPMNNSPENLVVVNNSLHRRIHWRIRKGADPITAVSEVLAEAEGNFEWIL